MLVDGALDFHLNLLQTVEEDFFLVFGQMQCLGRGIGKEGILLYSLSQRGAFYQVGVEQQAGGAGLHTFQHVDLGHLARGEAGYRAFLVIVKLFSIAYISAFGIFEEKGVYAIVQREMSGVSGGFGQVDYADQRVQGFETEHLVVLVYCIELDYFFHKRSC